MCTWPFEASNHRLTFGTVVAAGLRFSQKAKCRLVPILDKFHTTALLLEYGYPQVSEAQVTTGLTPPKQL